MEVTELREKSTMPCLAEIEIIEILKDLGCEIVHCCFGEADPYIAQQFLVIKI